MTLRRLLCLLRDDLARRAVIDTKPFNWSFCLKAIASPAALSVALVRLQGFLHSNYMPPFARLVRAVDCMFFNVDVDPAAEIEGGLVFMHASLIAITGRCRIGRDCVLSTKVTLLSRWPPCSSDPGDAVLTLGDSVFVGVGARIVGPVAIGAHCLVAANAAVQADMPPESLVAGVPARAVRKLKPAEMF
ncbi:MAG: hypothetical protein ABSE73_21975 [Planctomycetota bacterium]